MYFPEHNIRDIKILVIGDVMLDRYWFGEVDRISPEAPVPIVHIHHTQDCLGGAANVARNIVALGAQVSLIGLTGIDEAGYCLQQLAKDSQIEAHLIEDKTLPTTLKLRILGRQQQLLRIDFETKPQDGVLEQVQLKAQELIAQHDVLVLSDYAKGCLSQVEPLIELARSHGKPVLVDPKGFDYQRYTGATLVTPNRLEMQQATGVWYSEEELAHKAYTLREQLQLEALLVTRSEQGMTLFQDNTSLHVDANAHEVFDVSGAGDTVLAMLAVCRALKLSWQDTIYWANLAGGIVVGKLGTSTVSIEELNQCIS